jgi:ubiquinone/menaquinone biosynthesis C-methylase UbiE
MDDRRFDQETAMEWIKAIESAKGVRNTDIYPNLNGWINGISPSEVLEVGAGQGVCSDKIDLTNRNYTGAEPSPYLLERAMQLYPQASKKFVLGSAYALPFSDGTFDAAFSVAVWHLLSDLQTAANELSRVLSEKGSFYIITANPNADFVWKNLADPKDVLYFHSVDELENSFKSARLGHFERQTFRSSPEGPDLFLAIKGKKTT